MNDMASAFKKAGYKTPSTSPPKEEGKKVIKFYTDPEKKKLDSELITNKAEEWVNKFVRRQKDDLTSAQIRRFYGEVLSLEEKINEVEDFDVMLPYVKLLKSKAAYAANPGNRKIPDAFKDFIFQMVDSIKDKKDFKAFKTIFEAVVGYFYGKEGVK